MELGRLSVANKELMINLAEGPGEGSAEGTVRPHSAHPHSNGCSPTIPGVGSPARGGSGGSGGATPGSPAPLVAGRGGGRGGRSPPRHPRCTGPPPSREAPPSLFVVDGVPS